MYSSYLYTNAGIALRVCTYYLKIPTLNCLLRICFGLGIKEYLTILYYKLILIPVLQITFHESLSSD